VSVAVALALLGALQAPLAATPDTGRRVHDALHYDIGIAVSDTGGHIVGEVETTWRLGSHPSPQQRILPHRRRHRRRTHRQGHPRVISSAAQR